MKVGVISHDECGLHFAGKKHPEHPERIEVIQEALETSKFSNQIEFLNSPKISMELLYQVHTKEYVDLIFDMSPKKGYSKIDEDTKMNPHTVTSALRAAGAVVEAVNLIENGTYQRIFCNIRPPGHHTESDCTGGFCIFANVACGVTHAQKNKGFKKIAVIDFDAHHGDGTEEIVKNNSDVLFLSSYQEGLYPEPKYKNTDNIIHTKLKAGESARRLISIFRHDWAKRIKEFKPDLIFISAGYDAHEDDKISGLKFTDEDYKILTKEIMRVANEVCEGKVIACLEGGYHLPALASAVTASVEMMVKNEPEKVAVSENAKTLLFQKSCKPPVAPKSKQRESKQKGQSTKRILRIRS